jgi:hypothetical protein
LLIGRIYDDRGNRMSPSHARKKALWGTPRIHGELLKLGIEVSQATAVSSACDTLS